ncbi:hypothetical protein HGM15179_000681 [Zosterops borbonicus]|uniref:Uncharacterized protein n=1 Tax=Zosterops borbonicus TaxID=364589 RepID=A0A8K1LU97_9PASS|nr:hypothetical protein HGM15179_000681 [Zosterops borbonicus]
MAKKLTKPLSSIYCQSWSSGEVLVQWKSANVVPIYRNGRKEDPGNYGTFSLTSVLMTKEDNKAGEGSGAQVLSEAAEGAVAVQPGEQEAQEGLYHSLQPPEGDVGENSDLSSLKQSCANQITGPFPLLCLALLPVKTMAKGMMRVMELAFLPGYTKKTYETAELFKDS